MSRRPLSIVSCLAGRRPAVQGFTLIELAIVLVVVGLLAGMAYPGYSAQLARSRRADARQSLLELAQHLERHRLDRGTYADAVLGRGGVYGATSRAGHYLLRIDAQGADTFTISATPQGTQADDACAAFGYNQLGEQSVSAAARLSAGQCWQ